MGQVFSVLTNFVEITGDFLTDFIWVGAIGVISFFAGWNITGALTDDLGHSKILMSITHWFFRIVVFCVLVLLSKGFYYLTQL